MGIRTTPLELSKFDNFKNKNRVAIKVPTEKEKQYCPNDECRPNFEAMEVHIHTDRFWATTHCDICDADDLQSPQFGEQRIDDLIDWTLRESTEQNFSHMFHCYDWEKVGGDDGSGKHCNSPSPYPNCTWDRTRRPNFIVIDDDTFQIRGWCINGCKMAMVGDDSDPASTTKSVDISFRGWLFKNNMFFWNYTKI